MSASRRVTLILDSRLDELDRLHATVATFCADADRANHASAIALCAEELVTNTILHGFNGEAGHPIAVELISSPRAIGGRIIDDGPPFDPTREITADLTSDIDDRDIGGLGRHLVSTMMDQFRYVRDCGRNVVSFRRDVNRGKIERGDHH